MLKLGLSSEMQVNDCENRNANLSADVTFD